MNYHSTVQEVYRQAAQQPAQALCCVPQRPMYLPGLHIPSIMHEMNYGCGSTVHLQDMTDGQRVLYVGVGGGLEALQLAYFARRPGAVIAVDPVQEMREAAKRNLEAAAKTNDWFDPLFVDIRDGDALDLPIDDETIDLAAQNCNASSPPQRPMYLPGLHIPSIMHEMNYGCGSTVHLQDMTDGQRVLYVGVGGGLEALQLAYFARRPGAVIAVDPVQEMREAAKRNLEAAAKTNDWFDPLFVDIRDGDALDLPIDDETIDLAAQNCLFNIFTTQEDGGDLERALSEMHRCLASSGRLSMSDPITPRLIPSHLRSDATLRAQCISGCLTYDRYIAKMVEAGFGSIEVRSRRPYRMLDRKRYDLDENLLLETVEVCAYKVPVPSLETCAIENG